MGMPATAFGDRNRSAACNKLTASSTEFYPQLQQHLRGDGNTYRFHTSPNTADRPRHRNRTVPSTVIVDQHGREHLYLNFWIESGTSSGVSSWAAFDNWEWSYDYISRWSIHQGDVLWKKARSIFVMLTGEAAPQQSGLQEVPKAKSRETVPQRPQSSWFSVAGIFSTVRSTRAATESRKAEVTMHDEGEVHVDLVRVSSSILCCEVRTC